MNDLGKPLGERYVKDIRAAMKEQMLWALFRRAHPQYAGFSLVELRMDVMFKRMHHRASAKLLTEYDTFRAFKRLTA